MAEATNGVQQMAMMMLNPQFAAQQQKFALQQAMAQEMMKQGSEEPPTNQLANPGGMVVQNSPWAALSRAVEKGVGAYSAQKAIGDQMAAYQDLYNKQHPVLPQAQNAVMAGQQGPLTEEQTATARQLSDQLRSGQPGNQMQAMYSDPEWLANTAYGGADNATKAWLAEHGKTDLQKNVGDPTTAPYVQKDLVTTGPGNVPLTVKSVVDHYNGAGQPAPATPGANPSPVSPQGNGGPVVLQGTAPKATYNPYNPNENAGAAAGAVKTAENTVDAFKDQQNVQSETNVMLKNSQHLIETADTLLKNHPILANSNYLFNKANEAQKNVPFLSKDINIAVNDMKQWSAANLLPSIKQYLKGTGQVKVFEGANLEKVFSYDPTMSIQANRDKWMNGIQQIQLGQQGANNLVTALKTGQIQGAPTAAAPNQSSPSPSGNLTPEEQAELAQLRQRFAK